MGSASVPCAVDTGRLRLIKPRLLALGIKAHDQRANAKRSRTTRLRIPLLHARNIFCNVLDADRVLNRQSVALGLQPRLVDQNSSVGIQTSKGKRHVVVQKADFGRRDARVLQLHCGALFAAQHDVSGAFDTDGTGAAFHSLESIFDLEDVAVGGEHWESRLAGEDYVNGGEDVSTR